MLWPFLFLINQFQENPIMTKYQILQTEIIKLQENYSDALNEQTELLKINNQLFAETKKLRIAQVVLKKKSDSKTPGIELLARTAFARDPLVSRTSSPVFISTATVIKGIFKLLRKLAFAKQK